MAESAKTGSEAFGELLRSARERLGMSRRDLAEATGLSYPYISQLETGYRMPSSPAMRSLADALGLRVDSLFDAIPPTGSRDTAPPPPSPPARAAVRVPAAAPVPAAHRAMPVASPAGGAAAGGAPGSRAPGGSADAAVAGAAADSSAAGGGWIQNQRYVPSVARATPGTGAPPTFDARSAGVAAAREPNRDRVVDEATALLGSVPAGDRLAVLGEVQDRVVRSVVEDRVRDAGAPD
ncbi:MAG TPA: helix-turn-helix transcriptional regulator [Nakamurella sp.]|jgi:DNA-binding XRE family transcriptional regulator